MKVYRYVYSTLGMFYRREYKFILISAHGLQSAMDKGRQTLSKTLESFRFEAVYKNDL